MTKEMVIAANRHETKVAVLEDDQLVEVYFQRANEYSLAGSIHKGRVTRVLPGMQSAFVDLGLDRDTFLYVSDFFEESDEEFDQVPAERETRGDRGGREQRPPKEERAPREQRQESRHEQAPREIAAAPAPEPAAAPEAVAPPTEAADAAGDPNAGERANRGDRAGEADRHRRSRRRRSRGRGFPDSKYASSSSYAPPERTAAEPVETAAVAEPVETKQDFSQDFSILPGESLAKYRHTPAPVEELNPAQAVEPEQNGVGTLELMETPAAPPSVDELEVDELVAEALAEAATPEPEAATAVEPEPVGAAEASEPSEPEVEQAEAQPAAHETRDETPAETPEETAAGDSPSSEGSEASDAAGPAETAEAAVRSNSGRYMQHRVSRRMRRRMRSQGRPEGEARPEGEPSPEAVTAPEPAKVETRPEVRSEVRPDARSEPRSESRPEPRQEPRAIARPEKAGSPLITDLLKEGQEIIVQIAKEPLGQKGARITSHIALPGRYVVYMPTLEHMGVSRKIASDEERHRLKRILVTHAAGIQGGFIVRTAGEGKTEDEIAADMNFLGNLWIDIRQKAEKRPAPVLLHHDLDIVQRLLRDQLTENFKAIWVDNEEVYESILRFVQRFQPALVSRIKLYTRPAPIFDAFGISPELEKALRPKVWLKSGGYIVINQTEALVAIDVNTGKFVGKSNRLEDTIVKTNTEAVKEIVRQIRLRDLGGIIVVDFIDMDERKNRQKVMQVLEEAMRSDKAPNKILQFNDFGLVAITRKRVKQSLERALCAPCPYCEGAGYVKSVQTIIGEILQEAQKIATAVQGENNVILRVNPDVAKLLKSTQNKQLEELEAILRRPVMVKGDPLLHHEKFDLA